MKDKNWVILIGAGYGAFLFEGTETDAEIMRKHKANWEQGIGLRRLATKKEVKTKEISQCLNHKGFKHKVPYYCDCGEC